MIEDLQFPKPDVKIVDVQTNQEKIEKMPDNDYIKWLQECKKNTILDN